ncbi:DUF7059 domain-containing protein [Fodinicola feengrottensis]|uniref:DUF7059 domain-containing protein n=1 Tax=Fodinicola feengrottensis TaxID=435914 RepID=UPI00244348DB|nr:hypothetical protein [Fodinicola feengrottensis]
MKPLFSSDVTSKLRAAVEKAGYTAEGVAAVLGPQASVALGRGDLLPARRATSGGSPLETLINLFVCGGVLSTPTVQAALDPLRVDQALSVGLVEPARGGVCGRRWTCGRTATMTATGGCSRTWARTYDRDHWHQIMCSASAGPR